MKKTTTLILALLMTFSLVFTMNIVSQATTNLKGDIDKSGDIGMMDYILTKRAYFGTFTFSAEQITAGDVNNNSVIDMMDYILIKRIYFGTYQISQNPENGTDNNNSATTNSIWKISRARHFSDGVAFVTLYNYETYNSYSALIDVKGNILFNPSDMGLSASNFSQYKNGVSIYKYNDYIAVYDKNGDIVISSEKQGYDNILAYSPDYKYFIVNKIEESFSGDVYLVGIIDNNGNYIEELSSENIIAEYGQATLENGYRFNIQHAENDIFYIELRGLVITERSCYYHINRKTATSNYNHIECDQISGIWYKYDELGNRTELFPDKEIIRMFDSAVLVRENEGYYLLDLNGNVLMNLSKYNLPYWGDKFYSNGYLLTEVENTTGAKYCCLFDSKGELVFEPIRMQSNDYYCHLNRYGFVYGTYENYTFKYTLYKYDGSICVLDHALRSAFENRNDMFEWSLEIGDSGNGLLYYNEYNEIVITSETIHQ